MDAGWQILWTVCGLVTIIAAGAAARRPRMRYAGRAAVGILFLVGGAVLHLINLATGIDYAGFADPAHFGWVTDAWRAVVAPHQVLFIGLLATFEATVGALVLSGGRRTWFGYLAVIAFYLPLWLFGWFETVWVAVMLAPMIMLANAEREAARAQRPPADGSTSPGLRPRTIGASEQGRSSGR
jgi:hypothetical protein